MLVHFKGHNSIYDEWLDLPLANSGSDSDVRLALAGAAVDGDVIDLRWREKTGVSDQ